MQSNHTCTLRGRQVLWRRTFKCVVNKNGGTVECKEAFECTTPISSVYRYVGMVISVIKIATVSPCWSYGGATRVQVRSYYAGIVGIFFWRILYINFTYKTINKTLTVLVLLLPSCISLVHQGEGRACNTWVYTRILL